MPDDEPSAGEGGRGIASVEEEAEDAVDGGDGIVRLERLKVGWWKGGATGNDNALPENSSEIDRVGY